MMPATMLTRPPFRLHRDTGPVETGAAIAECIDCFRSIPAPLSTAFSLAMRAAAIAPDDSIHKAGMAIARDIDAGIGAGIGNAYHNANHFLEVLLCSVAIGSIANLAAHEKALVCLAAVAHDFHHDGQPNGQPYRLESLAVTRMQPYLLHAGLAAQDMQTLAALVFGTETNTGVLYARSCYRKHFQNASEDLLLAATSALTLLESKPRMAMMALTLSEADVLPSIGLTVHHARSTATRLEQELGKPLNSSSKIAFIDDFVGELQVAAFFTPNVRMVRQAFLDG